MLNRSAFCALMCVLLVLSGNLTAAEWARKMFKKSSHDFGTIARGSKAEFTFELENIYEEDVHLAGVRSSCGCATVKISDPTVKTWEKSSIVVTFNTKSFIGKKSASIAVSIDKPYPAEVQLTVTGYVRNDVVLTPGCVEFGEVDLGQSAEKKLSINHVGRGDWKIVDVRGATDYFEASLAELQRGSGRVGYELLVRLKDDAPSGYINDQLALVTNDQRNQQIPFMVTGRVLPPVTVSPSALTMGVVETGKAVTKQLVVRAKKPFRITAVHCDDQSFAFKTSSTARRLHLVPVTFTAQKPSGSVSQTIEIETDLVPGAAATCVATATVKPST